MASPLEIITGPLTLWYAATGSTYPDTSTTPASPWTKIGASGESNYTEDGVVIAPSQTVETFRPLGESGPVKAFVTEEDLLVRVTVADMTLEMVALAFNQNTVATDAGPPAIKTLGLYRGAGEPAQLALLIRGSSPYAASVNMQFEVPVAVHSGSFEMTFAKSPPAGVVMEFSALVDPSASSADEKFGRLIAQTA